ncbi:MAG TPA: VOC family protein [Polyangiales bacterium]|nr:VOC family protein [Polyangiales bacterium]
MLTRFDHLTIAARELDPAVTGYEKLFGFAPSWRGSHPELGTHSALFALGNAWIELVAPLPGAAEAEGLHLWLNAHGEGLQAIAFATADAAACSAALRERGIRATPPQPGTAIGSDGSARHYRTVELSPRQTRGLNALIVERDAAQAVELSAKTAVPADSCDALDHVVVRTADPDAAIALYGRGLGIRLALDRTLGTTRMLFFRVGGVTVEVVHDPSLHAGDQLQGAAYRARDLDAMHARLQTAGFDTSDVRDGRKPGTRVMTIRDAPCGVPTLLLRDPARD